ncbi:PTS transporter subunit IIC [Pseudalkalibacillus hwajinpoensis]|uniref:PTS sugar transporter subunit IIC n=1 Tax=Guptibacillus hwajinpoensis TaxID=208199 RepID=A0A4U1MCC5_9BACL|nr:PTS sugar transporter subunit IIC [Pseudalkalibacillus hwajinpoensis]TKD67972.1 PTS sugar transporter subunit IIC [Pseudalkalibacillus hwajinpoensis]
MKEFLQKKGITLSPRVYFITALSYMALGLFSSLIIGLILKTIGGQIPPLSFLIPIGTLAMELMGPAIGVAVAYGLGAPPLVLFASLLAGAAGAELGGPAGSYVAAIVAAEAGKLVSKSTKLDIIITPLVTIFAGFGTAKLIGPGINTFMTNFGSLIMWATEQRPILMGIIVAVLMGLALTAPISSAAIAIMLGLEGLAAGAATIGCAAQMVGFAVSSYRENGFGGVIAQGVGTSMLQVANIVRNPWILVPPTVAGAIIAPFGSGWIMMVNNSAGAGMGTSGFVGQIMTLNVMGASGSVWLAIVLLHFIGPAVISLLISELMRKKGLIRPGDMRINTE